MGRAGSPANRRKRAIETFKNAAESIGPVEKGMSMFAVTRGQWSMIDAVLHLLDEVGPSKISLWTWTVADYEVEVLTRLRIDERLTDALLVIDHGARNKNAEIIKAWKDRFGPESVRYVVNHAKIATVESESGFKLLARGSMNLNFNPRFEQFDLTEGGEDFELVKRIESELPILEDDCEGSEVYAASKVSDGFEDGLKIFGGFKTWGESKGMVKMTRDEAIAILLKHNPANRRHAIELFVSAFLSYLEAEINIREYGDITGHNRTGVPIDNPYLKVRTSMMNDMNKCGNLEGLDELWSKAGL